ncbi:MAG: hypothetical protein FWG70_08630 [Oscillospiraceae bacterium]|nr:hypothetical protein [Oscillospiraceae bacterium]
MATTYSTTTLNYTLKHRFICEQCNTLSDWVSKEKSVQISNKVGYFTNTNILQNEQQKSVTESFAKIQDDIKENLDKGKSISFLGVGKCKSCRKIQSWSKLSVTRLAVLVCGIILGGIIACAGLTSIVESDRLQGGIIGLGLLVPSAGYLLIYDLPARARHKKYAETLEKRNRPEIMFVVGNNVINHIK